MQTTSFTLKELAAYTQSELVGDPRHIITNVESLEEATSSDASFLANPRYEQHMLKSQAGVVFVAPTFAMPKGRNVLINTDPSRAFQKTAEAFHGSSQEFTGFAGIHPTVVIHPTASIGKDVQIGPHAVIDKGAQIGERSKIGAGSFVGPHTKIGTDCFLHPNVTVRERCIIGNRVILQPGVVIGSCGFGYTTDKQGRHTKLNQLGNVIIEDDVEIGANTTIDRSRFKNTEIRRGTKIDNLVQIGHGVIVGEDNIIVAQTGVAGSTKLGKNVILAGQVAVAGHLQLCDGVVMTARSGVTKSITEAGKYGGLPVVPLQEYNRNSVYLRNIETYIQKVKELEERLQALEETEGT